jgi:Asp/Glu/hydantoin racemase
VEKARYAGTKGSGFNAISLHGDGPFGSLVAASLEVVNNGGAEVVVLGCAVSLLSSEH